ncbi:hypothetical protein [Paludibacterium yongneupense]|uniref:hypothetical protein n=1 Tax=Paludibacterium yongneupense TaxID=400061 RepID=UPI000402B7D4|nr:hypothetical protein [Paludibacterium yongneupense]
MFLACMTAAVRGMRGWQNAGGVALFLAIASAPSWRWFLGEGGPLREVLRHSLSLVAAQLTFVLLMWPHMLGVDAPWSRGLHAFFGHPSATAALLAGLFAATLLLPRLPVLGEVHAFQSLTLGGALLAFIARYAAARSVAPWPGIVFALYELLLCVGVYIATGAIAVVMTRLFGRLARGREVLLILYLAAGAGFLPLFVYGAWLGGGVGS